jgi:hypothetical protein
MIRNLAGQRDAGSISLAEVSNRREAEVPIAEVKGRVFVAVVEDRGSKVA